MTTEQEFALLKAKELKNKVGDFLMAIHLSKIQMPSGSFAYIMPITQAFGDLEKALSEIETVGE